MKRLALLLLASTVLFCALPLGASAYGVEDRKLIITHINSAGSTEGSAIVIAGTNTSSLGSKGSFAWWDVVIFDWDDTDKCFKVVEKDIRNASSADKGGMVIPKYGFAYCICVGNDYPSIGQPDKPNYVQKRIQDSKALVKELSIGQKAYLYNTQLSGGVIETNGKEWYADDFVSNSFVKIDNPEKGLTAYDPVANEHALTQYKIEPNHVNSDHYATGDCNLFTDAFGSYVKGDYSWWSSLVFAWDQTEECYVCVAIDTNAATGCTKNPPIPKNGFVIMDCSSASKGSVAACSVGTKAWLYKSGSNYTIYLNLKKDGLTPVTPEGSYQAETPEFSNLSYGNVATKCTDEGFEIKWKDGSPSKYILSVMLSTPNTFNKQVVAPVEVTGTSYKVAKGVLVAGNTYTVVLSAVGGKKLNSLPTIAKLYCTTKEALNSSLADKNIVAFGDSLTARTGWVSMLGGKIGSDVWNAGVGGDSTRNAIARVKADVVERKPDIVLLCFGMNDQAQVISSKKPNVSLEDYIKNMSSCIEQIQKAGSTVVLIAPHDAYNGKGYYVPGNYGLDYSFGNMKQFCEAVRQLAIKYGCDFVDIYSETGSEDMSKFLNAGDGIHQSPYGHGKWAEYVSNYLLAKYDGIKKATISVVCKDEKGNAIARYSFTAANGSKMQIPAKEIAGYTLKGSEKSITVNGNTEIVYTYSGGSAEIKGDVNGDKKLNASDYMLVKACVIGSLKNVSNEMKKKMDVNGDNSVSPLDYLLIKNAVIKNTLITI